MRASRSLHNLWRKAVRAPLNELRARLRRRDRGALQGGRAGLGRPDDGAGGRSVRGTASAARRPMHRDRGLPVPDETPRAQRQFDDVRGDALRPAHGRRAGDDARTSRRSVLVPEARAPDFDNRAWSGVIRSSGPSSRGFSPPSRRSSSGGGLRVSARRCSSRSGFPALRVIAGEHLLIANSEQPNYGHYLLDIVPLIHLGAKIGAPMLSWTLKPWQRALIARLDVPQNLIREIRPRPVLIEHVIVSNRHSGMSSQNAHPQHREAFAAILANVRKAAPGLKTPRRVLVCRGLANSRNLENRAEMIEALEAAGLHGGSAREAELRRAGADLRPSRDHRLRIRGGDGERDVLPAGNENYRDHRRGAARPVVVASGGDARTRARRPVPAPDRKGSGGRAAACEGLDVSHTRST